jgi:hypothetical protein
METFFLTYHSFTSPQVIFDKLVDRYHVPRFEQQTLLEFDRFRLNVQSRICNLLKTWTKTYTASFLDVSSLPLIEAIRCFTENVLVEDKQIAVARQIRRNLFQLVINLLFLLSNNCIW